MGQWIELQAADGVAVAAWRAEPPGPVRGGLIVVQEIFGVNAHIRGVCDRYALRATSPSRPRSSTATGVASTGATRRRTSRAAAR